jgi:hypothetical protein
MLSDKTKDSSRSSRSRIFRVNLEFFSRMNNIMLSSEVLRLGLIVVVAVLVFYVYQNGASLVKNEGMVSEEAQVHVSNNNAEAETGEAEAEHSAPKRVVNAQLDDMSLGEVLPHPQISTGLDQGPGGCFPKDQLTSSDLMPRENANASWSESNPPVPGQLGDKNFLESGHHYGLNTVGQSLKNANLQLRSDPLIPQRSVGPWNQSTITADTNRRPFEINA